MLNPILIIQALILVPGTEKPLPASLRGLASTLASLFATSATRFRV